MAQLHDEKVPTYFFEQAEHDEFVDAGGEEKGYKGGSGFGEMKSGDGGMVDVAEEEVVDGSVRSNISGLFRAARGEK